MTRSAPPRRPFAWADAVILAGSVFGILMGVSLISFQAAAALGVALLVYVIIKLFTTQA